MAHSVIAIAFEDLAQSLRVLLEAYHRAEAQGLLQVDRPEAVGNIETGLSSVLNAFHSLYDAIEKQLGVQPVDWYGTPELALLLALRNARHHNKANKIRTLYTYHAHESTRPNDVSEYVLVDFPLSEEGGDTFDVFLSWIDLDAFLNMSDNRLRRGVPDAIRQYLRSQLFAGYATQHELDESRVFFNITPLIVNGALAIVPHIHGHLRPLSTESEFFAEHFKTVGQAATSTHEVTCGSVSLPA